MQWLFETMQWLFETMQQTYAPFIPDGDYSRPCNKECLRLVDCTFESHLHLFLYESREAIAYLLQCVEDEAI